MVKSRTYDKSRTSESNFDGRGERVRENWWFLARYVRAQKIPLFSPEFISYTSISNLRETARKIARHAQQNEPHRDAINQTKSVPIPLWIFIRRTTSTAAGWLFRKCAGWFVGLFIYLYRLLVNYDHVEHLIKSRKPICSLYLMMWRDIPWLAWKSISKYIIWNWNGGLCYCRMNFLFIRSLSLMHLRIIYAFRYYTIWFYF